jgi:hypothetical protein
MSEDRALERAQKSGRWFAPSLFITYYGGWGFKFEAECYRHRPDGTIEHDYLNVDGPSGLSKSEMYKQTKDRFWKTWNREHPGQLLTILKSVSAYGL